MVTKLELTIRKWRCRRWRHWLWRVLDDWLTVHRSITLVDLQLVAQNSYLFIYNTFIKILYMFRALPCSSSEGLRRNCIHAASGIATLCRRLSCAPVKKEFFLNRCTGQSPGIATLCKWLSCAPVKKEFFLNRYTGQSPAENGDTRGCIYTITT